MPLLSWHMVRVAQIYQAAFAGYPWFEPLTIEEVLQRLEPLFVKPGFTGCVVVGDGRIVAAHWHDIISIGQLRKDRGDELAQWVIGNGYDEGLLIWERELIVDPEYQRKGLAHQLRNEFLQHLIGYRTPLLVLTRLREDNFGSIKSAQTINMFDTGVTKPASQAPLKHHYWALTVG